MKDAMGRKRVLFNYSRADTQPSEQVGSGNFGITIKTINGLKIALACLQQFYFSFKIKITSDRLGIL